MARLAAPMAPQGGAPFLPSGSNVYTGDTGSRLVDPRAIDNTMGTGGFLPGNPKPADYNRPTQVYNPPADDPRDPRTKGMYPAGGFANMYPTGGLMAPQGGAPLASDRKAGQRYLPPEPNSMGGPGSEGRFVGPENSLYNTLAPAPMPVPTDQPSGFKGGVGGVQPTTTPTTPMPVPTQQPSGFKGGVGGAQPAPMPTPMTVPAQQPQYAPMAAQGQFNVNQASAGALQQALGTTEQAMQRPINIGAYANPYENQVVQQSIRDVGSAAQMGINQLDAQAGAAQAFGGSRHGIAQAEAMKGFNQQAMDQAAQLRSQGFNTSLQAAMADRQARLGAASQLGQLGQQAFGTGQAIQQQQMQQGLLQQGIQQALIDAARQQYAGYTGAPTTALQAPLAALGVTPAPQTTTNTMQPGLFNYLQLGASMVPK
jgi:hypothetical protein